LSRASVRRLLAQLGLTCQKPLHRALERNEALVKQWLKKEYPKIKALAHAKKPRFTSVTPRIFAQITMPVAPGARRGDSDRLKHWEASPRFDGQGLCGARGAGSKANDRDICGLAHALDKKLRR